MRLNISQLVRIKKRGRPKRLRKKRKGQEQTKIIHFDNYEEYLLSEHWLCLRKRKLDRTGWKCEFCGTKKFLQVHHHTYQRLGKEWMSDLFVLCRSCHGKVHEYHREHPNKTLTQATIYVKSKVVL